MGTLYVVLDETNRAWKAPPKVTKDVHHIIMRLDSMQLTDEEIVANAQTLAMMLLTAVRDAHVEPEPPKSKLIIKQ
jgi:hypothetical protein